ncbi:MAG: DUF1540 domain-containing protein [Acetobacteraceae bacterium]|nr:DUF1540 domain-containing protein [Acetobacteraceae bacterium]
MEVPRTRDPINRVKCVVDNCMYWETGNRCRAESIEVQGPDATTVEHTDCATFECREEIKKR